MEKVEIVKSDLVRMLTTEGKNKRDIALHYGVPLSEITRIMKENNLRARSYRKPRAKFVDDTPVNEESNSQESEVREVENIDSNDWNEERRNEDISF